MTKTYTAAEVAALLQRTPMTITRHARLWGIGEKRAGAWFFSDRDIQELRVHTSRKGGPMPRKEQT